MRAGESLEDRVLLLDSRREGIAVRADDLARLADSESVGQAKIRPLLVALGVQTGFKGRQQRTSGLYIFAAIAGAESR